MRDGRRRAWFHRRRFLMVRSARTTASHREGPVSDGGRHVGAGGTKNARLKDNFLFLSKFLRHGTTIASVWPSSKALSKATIKPVSYTHLTLPTIYSV